LTPVQLQGLHVFQKAGCIQCHGGPMLSDFKLHFIGLPDSTTEGRRSFRTPTLRNLRHTAPYMHNGSLRTVSDVLDFYDRLSEAASETLDGGDRSQEPALDPLLRLIALEPGDSPFIEAFLDALSSDNYDEGIPDSVPSGLPVLP